MLSVLNRGGGDTEAVSLDARALEARALGAGTALACCYSSSAEYDAALIAERRAAGVYGPKRYRREMLATAAGVVAALAVLALLII
jgi:hypothetical protein